MALEPTGLASSVPPVPLGAEKESLPRIGTFGHTDTLADFIDSPRTRTTTPQACCWSRAERDLQPKEKRSKRAFASQRNLSYQAFSICIYLSLLCSEALSCQAHFAADLIPLSVRYTLIGLISDRPPNTSSNIQSITPSSWTLRTASTSLALVGGSSLSPSNSPTINSYVSFDELLSRMVEQSAATLVYRYEGRTDSPLELPPPLFSSIPSICCSAQKHLKVLTYCPLRSAAN